MCVDAALLRLPVAPMPFRWRTSPRVSRECVRTGFAWALLHVSRLKEQVDPWAEGTLYGMADLAQASDRLHPIRLGDALGRIRSQTRRESWMSTVREPSWPASAVV
jgi:hypothetical protein